MRDMSAIPEIEEVTQKISNLRRARTFKFKTFHFASQKNDMYEEIAVDTGT
jgi:hypothetical protein